MNKPSLSQVLLWVVTLLVFTGSQYYYHPDTTMFAISLLILLGLLGLVTWSVSKIKPAGFGDALKGLVVAAVAGFMAVQGMDVAYSVNFVPAGNRYIELVETPILALAFFLPAYLSFRFGSQQKKDSNGGNGEQS